MAKDLLITLEDRPGEGARLGEALGNAGVNIEGLCAVANAGRGMVHVLVEDVAGARTALGSAGITIDRETDVIVGPPIADTDVDKPGLLGAMAGYFRRSLVLKAAGRARLTRASRDPNVRLTRATRDPKVLLTRASRDPKVRLTPSEGAADSGDRQPG